MRLADCLVPLAASVSLPVGAQSFFNLDFEQARLESLPPPTPDLPWEEAIPGWGTFLSQTGTVPPGARELSILSSSFMFTVRFDGARLPLRPVGPDPSSPT